jgi:guanylate kinase
MTRQQFLESFPKLIKGYRAASNVLERISSLKLLIIIGPSGVGKTSIIQRLGFPYVAADITRPKRPEEKDGVDYNFRNDYEQVIEEINSGQFVQTAVGPGGDFYSTKATSYPDSGTAVMAVVADVVPIFRNLGFKETLSIFVVPPSYNEWMRRLKSHPVADEQLQKRLAEAKRSLVFALDDEQTHFILNDDLDKAIQQTQELINGSSNAAREKKAREAAEEMLKSIN